MVLYLAADLLWATRIKATAEALGVAARPVRSLEMLEARLAEGGVRLLLLDLDKPDEAMAMLARMRGGDSSAAERGVRIIAWGPHVETALLAAAKAAGADQVLVRGAFDRVLPELLRG